jgi:hypothetical protein
MNLTLGAPAFIFTLNLEARQLNFGTVFRMAVPLSHEIYLKFCLTLPIPFLDNRVDLF